MPSATGVSVSASGTCNNGYGEITANVVSGREESLWVVFTNTGDGTQITSTQVPGVTSYTFVQPNLANGYWEVQAYGSISGPAQVEQYVALNCVRPNNGNKGYRNLEEYYTATGQATGNTKPNSPTDPDYIAPSQDLTACPL